MVEFPGHLVSSNLLFVVEPGQDDVGVPGIGCLQTYLF